ncbi:MAG: hypothetical protein K2O28_01460 [Clostridia bacterium]|nr:hypothetical protein [Clostridia bacterium]
MKTIINISSVTDYSGETPIITDSNPVTTVIREPSPTIITTRVFCCQSCDCDCCCNCCN